MAKIANDKYYTPIDLAEYCVKKVKEIIGEENISEWIEPSGGNGVFLDYLPKGTYSCDIEPEDSRVVKQDFLELDLGYKEGRCIIGNPPFGFMTKLAIKFFNKSILLGDYVAFILPISFLNNQKQIYKFDLIYSEDLGINKYSDRDVYCCFNIYKRPINGLNSKIAQNFKLSKDLKITEIRQGNKICEDYDFAFCSWGSVGKEITQPNSRQFAKEFYVKIYNNEYKNNIIDLIKNVNWIELYNMKPTYNLLQWQVYKYLKEKIPELE